MTLQASGAISLGQVDTELGLSATATISLGDTNVRTLLGVASGSLSLSNAYGKSNIRTYNITITTNTADLHLPTLTTAAGWPGGVVCNVNCTINSGVYVYGSTTATPAFRSGTSVALGGVWVAGTVLTLTNNGIIMGCGGAGAAGTVTVTGGNGLAGGQALSTSFAITVTNNGTIAGGGGGGGSGSGVPLSVIVSGAAAGSGGGGGGQGYNGGAGGTFATGTLSTNGTNGAAGTSTAAGAAGTTGSFTNGKTVVYSGASGAGGTSGVAGGAGAVGSYTTGATGGAGGAAGLAYSTASYITWAVTGTRLGPTA
jgi:hypothetical protein